MHVLQSFCIAMFLVLFRHNKTPKVFCLTFGVHVNCSGSLFSFLLEILKIIIAWLQLALLDLMDDFHYFVVHRGRAAYLSAVVGNSSVDCVHLGQFTFFEVLEHAGLQLGVFADGDRDYEE